MTAKDLISELEACYGPYLPRMKGYALGYLEQWSESRLDSLWKLVLRTYEPYGRTPPAIAIMEKLRPRTTDDAGNTRQAKEIQDMYAKSGKIEDRSAEATDMVARLAESARP